MNLKEIIEKGLTMEKNYKITNDDQLYIDTVLKELPISEDISFEISKNREKYKILLKLIKIIIKHCIDNNSDFPGASIEIDEDIANGFTFSNGKILYLKGKKGKKYNFSIHSIYGYIEKIFLITDNFREARDENECFDYIYFSENIENYVDEDDEEFDRDEIDLIISNILYEALHYFSGNSESSIS